MAMWMFKIEPNFIFCLSLESFFPFLFFFLFFASPIDIKIQDAQETNMEGAVKQIRFL